MAVRTIRIIIQPVHSMPSVGLIRLDTVLEIIPLSRSAWWAGVKQGRFPKGIKFSSNVTAWKMADILRLAAGDESIEGMQDMEGIPNIEGMEVMQDHDNTKDKGRGVR